MELREAYRGKPASTGLFSMNGFEEPGRPADHALMSPGVSVEIYGLERD